MKLSHCLATGLLGALVACSNAEAPANTPESFTASTLSSEAETGRLVAILVYADWCGSCKVLDPKLQAAKAEGAIDGVSYHILDYTARDEDSFFAAADALGAGTAIRSKLSDGVKTGILLLVDVDDGEIVGDLRKELSSEDIRAALEAAALDA